MKLSKRDIVVILSGLIVQQEVYHRNNPAFPSGSDFTLLNECYELTLQVQAENPVIEFAEMNELFTRLMYEAVNDLTPEQEELLNLPPSEYIQ